MAHKNAHLWKQFAEDAANHDEPWKLWEFLAGTHWLSCSETIIMFHPEVKYRRKPTKKPVDLSLLIESGIDCEFNNDLDKDTSLISKVTQVGNKPNGFIYSDSQGYTWKYCQPRYDHWHAWLGGKCPLPEGFMVEVIFRAGNKGGGAGEQYDWEHSDIGNGDDIIAFRVTDLADSHCMPWEV